MLNKPMDGAGVNPTSAFAIGREQTEAMLGREEDWPTPTSKPAAPGWPA
jgi:hypothetical protein